MRLAKEVYQMSTASIANASIRERVGAYITRERVTKQSIADLLGVSLNTLNSKLDGNSSFTLEQAFELADLMGCNVDDLRRPLL